MTQFARNGRLAAGLLLLAAYALPLLAPPATASLAPPGPASPLGERLFPGVPGTWVAARLGCLVLGAMLVVTALRELPRLHLHVAGGTPAPPVARARLLTALAFSACHAGLAPWASELSRSGQAAYFAALAVPAFLLVRRAPRAPLSREACTAAVAVACVVCAWVLLRIPVVWHAPRAANPVDAWQSFLWNATAVAEGRNFLAAGSVAGSSANYAYLMGVSLLGDPGFDLSFSWWQGWQVLWLAATGLGVAWLAGRAIGGAAAPVAASAFLFSPFVLSLLLTAMPLWGLLVYTAALLLLLRAVVERRSLAALAALGPVAGLAAGQGHMILIVPAVLAAAAASALRRPRVPWPALAIPLLSFVAIAGPAFPDLDALRSAGELHVGRHGVVLGLEATLFGQEPLFHFTRYADRGRPGLLDVPLGTLLAPFAVARSSLRLWGDALLDPLGGALVAIGLGACVRLRASFAARALLGLLVLALLPGLTSSYDRAWPTRFLAAAPVAFALLAAVGLEALRLSLFSRRRVAIVAGTASAAIALGGTALFDLVNPRILASSSLGIALAFLEDHPTWGGAAVLDYPTIDLEVGDEVQRDVQRYLYVRPIVTYLPLRPVAYVQVPGRARDLSALASGPAAPELLFWSPGLESDLGIEARVCATWPRAGVYELRDEAGLSRVLMARPAGSGREPAWSGERWSRRRCGA